MAITEKVEKKETIVTKYVTSDECEFFSKSQAKVHEDYLRWKKEVERLGIPHIENAYYCKTETEYKSVVAMLACRYGHYDIREKIYKPVNHYEDGRFTGEDWYFFEYKAKQNYPSDYWLETLTQKKKEFEEWLQQFEDTVKNSSS